MNSKKTIKRIGNGVDIIKLAALLTYSDRYELNIQFWPDQTAVYIEKDGIELKSYGGDFDFAVDSSIEYLDRINKKFTTKTQNDGKDK